MKIGITVGEKDFDSQKTMFKTIKECGFSAIDYSGIGLNQFSDLEEKKYCTMLKEEAKNYDIVISQTHAPFLINSSESEFLGEKYYETVCKSIKRTALFGSKYIVIHPYCPQGIEFAVNAMPYDYSKLIEHNKEVNLKFFRSFIPLLTDLNITMCIENLFAYDILMQRHVLSACGSPEETIFYIDNLGANFGACFDSGHLNHFNGNETEYISKLGKRIKVLHLNDSWGKSFHGMDWHLMPGQGDVDWIKIRLALEKIHYNGYASFEISPRKGAFYIPQLKYIAEVGKAIFENNNYGESL